jgi:hypothetical protein
VILRILLCLSFLFVLPSCITRQEISAAIWLNNGLPSELCQKEPELRNYGFYRKLNSGKIEFISFCSARANEWLSMHQGDYNRLLEKALGTQQGQR